MSTTEWADEDLPDRIGEDLNAAELMDGTLVVAEPGNQDGWLMGDSVDVIL